VAEVGRRLRSADARTCVVPRTRTQYGDRSFAVAGRGSRVVQRLHCVTLTALISSESSWRRICLVAAAAHSDYVLCALQLLLLTYLLHLHCHDEYRQKWRGNFVPCYVRNSVMSQSSLPSVNQRLYVFTSRQSKLRATNRFLYLTSLPAARPTSRPITPHASSTSSLLPSFHPFLSLHLVPVPSYSFHFLLHSASPSPVSNRRYSANFLGD